VTEKPIVETEREKAQRRQRLLAAAKKIMDAHDATFRKLAQ